MDQSELRVCYKQALEKKRIKEEKIGSYQRWFESRGLTESTSSLRERWSTDLFVIDHVALKTVLFSDS